MVYRESSYAPKRELKETIGGEGKLMFERITAGISPLQTAKVFRPQVKSENGNWVDFNLAALRRNGLTTNNYLCSGDTFIELLLRGNGGDYYIPIDLWDL